MKRKIKKVVPWLLLSWGVLVAAFVLTIQILEPGPEEDVNAVVSSEEVSQEEETQQETASADAVSAGQEPAAEEPAGQDGPGEEAQESSITELSEAIIERNRLETLGEQELWEELGKYDLALIGDSRVVGFSIYGFVESRRVLAENGATIDDLARQINSAVNLAPDYIFIAYGINDIKERIGRTPEGYADYVESKVAVLQEKLPDTVILIQSVIPAREFLYSSTPAYREVEEYNDALREMSERNGWRFVDNSAIAQEHAGLYANDGIHLGAGFYKFWGQNMLLAVYDKEHGL